MLLGTASEAQTPHTQSANSEAQIFLQRFLWTGLEMYHTYRNCGVLKTHPLLPHPLDLAPPLRQRVESNQRLGASGFQLSSEKREHGGQLGKGGLRWGTLIPSSFLQRASTHSRAHGALSFPFSRLRRHQFRLRVRVTGNCPRVLPYRRLLLPVYLNGLSFTRAVATTHGLLHTLGLLRESHKNGITHHDSFLCGFR